MIILALDELSAKKRAGTAAWILSKPLSRVSFVLTKLASNAIGILLFILVIPAVVAYIEIWLASGELIPVQPYLTGMGVAALALLFYLTLTIMLGVLFDARGPVIGIGLALLFLGSILVQIAQPVVLVLPVAMHTFAGLIAKGSRSPRPDWWKFSPPRSGVVIFVIVALWRFARLEL